MPKHLYNKLHSMHLIFFAALTYIGCDDQPTGSISDVGGEMGGMVAGNSGGAQLGGGVAGEEQGGDEISCVWHSDCEEGQCQDGVCLPVGATCQFSTNCPLGDVCHENSCIHSCFTDTECPEAGHCVMGVCTPYPDDLIPTGALERQGSPEQVVVGIGIERLKYPVGVSLAGYGGRSGPRTPYNQSLGGSHSVVERQDIRAIIMDSGEEYMVLVRMPLSWSTDFLRTLIAREVGRLTQNEQSPDGINILPHLTIFATHSHSQPGRFWNLVPNLPFGNFGFGTYSHSITEGYARAAARAIVAAFEDRAPARIGWTILDEADPERRIHSNRRPTSDSFDDRLLALRIDDLDGNPRAAIVGFGIHGTHLMTPLISGDAAGGIEQILTEELSREYQAFVPAIFANGNAGNISPRGDHLTSNPLGHVQTLGGLLANVYLPLFRELETQADVKLGQRISRVEMRYETFGYGTTEPEFAGRYGPFTLGGFQCVTRELGEDDPPHTLEEPNCLLDIQSIVHEPISQFHKTVVSSLRINNLLLTTLPGEPTSGLGLNLAAGVESLAIEEGLSGARSFNFGYAQDHQFYLLEPDDWFRGGYEASMSSWGPMIGRYLSEQTLLAMEALLKDTEMASTQLKPTWWPNTIDDLRLIPDEAPTVAQIVSHPASVIQRGELIKVKWVGGDPAVDLPQVSLVHASTGEVVDHPISGLPFNDQGFESTLFYLGDYNSNQEWRSEWDLPLETAPGDYQLLIKGHISDGTSGQYELRSETFTLSGEDGIIIRDLRLEANRLTLHLTYADAPTNNDGVTPFNRLKEQGNYLHLLRHLDLSQPTPEVIKSIRYLIGAPVSGRLNLQIWTNTSPDASPPSYESIEQTINTSCSIELITARDGNGVDQLEQFDNVPCGALEIDLASLGEWSSLWIELSDEWGNQGQAQLVRE